MTCEYDQVASEGVVHFVEFGLVYMRFEAACRNESNYGVIALPLPFGTKVSGEKRCAVDGEGCSFRRLGRRCEPKAAKHRAKSSVSWAHALHHLQRRRLFGQAFPGHVYE